MIDKFVRILEMRSLTLPSILLAISALISLPVITDTCSSIPNSNDQENWNELKNHEASKSLNSDIESVQKISTAKGKLNNDIYSIEVDAPAVKASRMLLKNSD